MATMKRVFRLASLLFLLIFLTHPNHFIKSRPIKQDKKGDVSLVPLKLIIKDQLVEASTGLVTFCIKSLLAFV
ncbi:hypothetical protein D3H64_03240 [Atopobacter sp. AH10]|nr:hypothetical protein D3H64_03240 [Atopobacter sp. AH10]